MQNFDPKKAVEAVLFIANRLRQKDLYKALKVLYFADIFHLENFGRFICGDSYIAMRSGPVPSQTYDILKCVRGDGQYNHYQPAEEAFDVSEGHGITPHRDADQALLSKSDIMAMEDAVKNYGSMSGSELKEASHDQAYNSAGRDDEIPLESIANMVDPSGALASHITDPYPG